MFGYLGGFRQFITLLAVPDLCVCGFEGHLKVFWWFSGFDRIFGRAGAVQCAVQSASFRISRLALHNRTKFALARNNVGAFVPVLY